MVTLTKLLQKEGRKEGREGGREGGRKRPHAREELGKNCLLNYATFKRTSLTGHWNTEATNSECVQTQNTKLGAGLGSC